MPDAPTKSSLATLPLYQLVDMDLSKMSREQLTQALNHIRMLRTSPPTFAKQLRDDSEMAEANAAAPAKPKVQRAKKEVNIDQVMKDLEARLQVKSINEQNAQRP